MKSGPSNIELREMSQVALENWLFDQDTDPDGEVKRGLEFLATEGDYDQEIINARFDDLPRGQDKWDALEEMGIIKYHQRSDYNDNRRYFLSGRRAGCLGFFIARMSK